jgi:hypothetical protein
MSGLFGSAEKGCIPMSDRFKIVFREQGWPVGHSQMIEPKSHNWASVAGHIGQLADDCDSIIVYQNNKLVLRYDNDGIK